MSVACVWRNCQPNSRRRILQDEVTSTPGGKLQERSTSPPPPGGTLTTGSGRAPGQKVGDIFVFLTPLSYFFNNISNLSFLAVSSFLAMGLLLLRSGDIEKNPGPHRFYCPICQLIVGLNSVQCKSCLGWVHLTCSPFQKLPRDNIGYFCAICKPPTSIQN